MSPKSIIIYSAVLILSVVGLTFILTAGQQPPPATASYSAQENDRPQAENSPDVADLGEMQVSDIGQKDFTLKNSGTRPLQLLNINSSCGCTVGQIIYGGFTSKEFGMHAQSGFVTEIAPGDSATVRVVYRPAVMPVYGSVEREVYITTNDPQNPKLVFAVKAFVK